MREFDRMWRSSKYVIVDVIERQREWNREREGEREGERLREWKGKDRGRKGGIHEIITQENDAKLLHKILKQKKDTKLSPSISLHKSEWPIEILAYLKIFSCEASRYKNLY